MNSSPPLPFPLPPTLTPITSTDLQQYSEITARAFFNDALHLYLYLGKDSRPDHPDLEDFNKRVDFWFPMVKRNFDNGAVMVESSGWVGLAMW